MSAPTLNCSQMRDWDIIASPDAIPAERTAVHELQRLFAQATGVQLPVRYHAADTVRHVYVGPSAALNQSGLGLDTASMGEEELQVVVEKERVAIVGGRPRGTLYGVYQFLEDALGVRFLTHDHTHVPDASTVEIPCRTIRYAPPFSFRWSYYRENTEHPKLATHLRVNTVSSDPHLGGKTGQSLISHSFHWLVPFPEYGETHPEYYALVDGVRDANTQGGEPQLCVTHPDVIQIAAESAIRYLDEHPDARNVSVSQADTDRYCRCEACEDVNRREGTPMGAQLAFVNAVAERVEHRHPGVKVGTLAYWYTRKPPQTIRPCHNVQIQLCSIECCTLHPIDDPDCPRNRAFCQDMVEWAALCDDIWIWNYHTDFAHYDLPFPNLRSIGPDVRYFIRNNAKGLFMQANGNGLSGEFSDLRNYLIARLLWDPGLDDRAVLEEFVRLHYQESAQPVLDCIALLHDNAERSGVHPNCFPSADDVGLRPDIARGMCDCFEQALQAADSEMIRARVEKASICAYRALMETAGSMEDAEYEETAERYIALCQQYNMTHVNERTPFDAAQVRERQRGIELDPSVYEGYVGRYEIVGATAEIVYVLGDTVTVSVESGRFLVETKQGKNRFYAETETRFTLALDSAVKLHFARDDQGRATELLIQLRDGLEVRAERTT